MYARSRITCFIPLLVLLAPLAAQAGAEEYMSLSRHLVRVLAATADGRINTGSGVQVGAELVATSCHVAATGGSVLASRGSFGRDARAVTGDGTRDVCLLHISGELALPAPLAPLPKVGDAVHAVGFSGGKVLSMSDGTVTALREVEGGWVIQTDAAFRVGASGGGLFDAQGRLLGLLTFYSPVGEGQYFVVPAQWIAEAMADAVAPAAMGAVSDAPFWAALDPADLAGGSTLLAASRKPRGILPTPRARPTAARGGSGVQPADR